MRLTPAQLNLLKDMSRPCHTLTYEQRFRKHVLRDNGWRVGTPSLSTVKALCGRGLLNAKDGMLDSAYGRDTEYILTPLAIEVINKEASK